jgi:hypothetical protein
VCDNKVARFVPCPKEGLKCIEQTCTELKMIKESLYEEFRIKNRSDLCKGTDKLFERYKNEIEEFLAKCKDKNELDTI